MNHDELLFDKIEAYLRGKLPPAEATAFEEEIAANPTLAALVKTHRLEREGLEWLVERDLMAKMSTWERETMRGSTVLNQPAVKSRIRTLWWAASIAATLAVAFFGWWLLQPQEDVGGPSPIVTAPKPQSPVTTPSSKTPKPAPKPSISTPSQKEDDRVAETPTPKPTIPTPKPEVKPPSPIPSSPTPNYPALAASYYRETDFIQESKSTSGGDTPGYGQALDNFKSGKYSEVEKLLKPKAQNDPEALKNKELLAHSFYQRGQYADALPYLRQLSSASDKRLAERSEWAMTLTLLHLMPAQKPLLDRTLDRIVSNPNHTFHAKAKELKARIRG